MSMESITTIEWQGYEIHFCFPSGVRSAGTTPIQVEAVKTDGSDAATGYFRLRREWHEDIALGRVFDVLVISDIEVDSEHRRKGLGVAIVKALAQQFPEALIVGENPNPDAQAWHRDCLEVLLPTRLLRDDGREGVRIRPGAELAASELQ